MTQIKDDGIHHFQCQVINTKRLQLELAPCLHWAHRVHKPRRYETMTFGLTCQLCSALPASGQHGMPSTLI